ncbi:MAG: DUF2007 domain-containing protein [Anaerolineae bacterium]|jgi:hypothetical protein|nr:DUF2007 domain-containing protein [Anaerolineae bacterium]
MNQLLRRSNSDWVVVFSTPSRPEAHIVLGRLQHEGIRGMIHAEAGRDALGIHIGRFGEVQVLVHADDADQARAILDFILIEADDQETTMLDAAEVYYDWDEDEDDPDAGDDDPRDKKDDTLPRRP